MAGIQRHRQSQAAGREVPAYSWKDTVVGRLIRSAAYLAQAPFVRDARALEQDADNFGADPVRHVARAEQLIAAVLEPSPSANLLGRMDAIDRRVNEAVLLIEARYREEAQKLADEESRLSALLDEAVRSKIAEPAVAAAQNAAIDARRAELLRVRQKRRGVLLSMLTDGVAAKLRADAAQEKARLIYRAEEADSELELAAKAIRRCETAATNSKA